MDDMLLDNKEKRMENMLLNFYFISRGGHLTMDKFRNQDVALLE
jgi:hypothetical protein